MRKITDVALLAENRLLREALIRLLNKNGEVRVVGSHPYSPAVHELIIAAHPHIVLLDSAGLVFSDSTLLTALQTQLKNLRIIMVDMDSDEKTFLRAIRAGVVGYVLKDASALEVTSAIRAVAAGQAFCPPALSMAMFRYVAQQIPAPSQAASIADFRLSRREQEMVELLSERLTNKEIACRLNLSQQTVKNHVHRILRKVGASDRMTIAAKCKIERPQFTV